LEEDVNRRIFRLRVENEGYGNAEPRAYVKQCFLQTGVEIQGPQFPVELHSSHQQTTIPRGLQGTFGVFDVQWEEAASGQRTTFIRITGNNNVILDLPESTNQKKLYLKIGVSPDSQMTSKDQWFVIKHDPNSSSFYRAYSEIPPFQSLGSPSLSHTLK